MSELALLEPPPVRPETPVRAPLADLILLRLLCAKKSVSPKDLRADLAKLFGGKLDAEVLNTAIGQLKAEGFLQSKRGQRVTDAGRARALDYLGIEALPPRTDWRALKAKYLVPRALGLEVSSAELAKAKTGEALAALLLKRKENLPASVKLTMPQVLDALLCRELGHADFTSMSALISAKLGALISGEPLARKSAKSVVPRALLGIARLGVDELRNAILSRQFAPPSEPSGAVPATDEAFALDDFAATVKSVARTCPTGRFGDNKVFISHVWEQLKGEPRFARLGYDGFKAKLIEANRADLLTLSRADLVQLMDSADVRASEIVYLTATFHFILIEGT